MSGDQTRGATTVWERGYRGPPGLEGYTCVVGSDLQTTARNTSRWEPAHGKRHRRVAPQYGVAVSVISLARIVPLNSVHKKLRAISSKHLEIVVCELAGSSVLRHTIVGDDGTRCDSFRRGGRTTQQSDENMALSAPSCSGRPLAGSHPRLPGIVPGKGGSSVFHRLACLKMRRSMSTDHSPMPLPLRD